MSRKARIQKYLSNSIDSKLFVPLTIFVVAALMSSVLLFFWGNASEIGILSYFDALWWSIVTMSTTGYGDITPVTVIGRVIGIFAMLVGVTVTALFTGTVASVYLNKISRTRSGLMIFSKLKEHLIICGWRVDMDKLLLRIIDDGEFTIQDVVVVSDVEQSSVDKVWENPQLHKFKFVRGNYYDKNVLKRANVVSARKALVLSDQGGEHSGFEVDTRTVMTVITIKAINKNIYVSAQLLERNFEMYLRQAFCDEILFSNEMHIDILSLIVRCDGISNVMSELLGNTNNAHRIALEAIKQSFVGRPFRDLHKQYAEQSPNSLLLGVLENTVKKHEIRENAIRDAQKTADFTEMVKNLRSVKDLQSYNPVLIPDMNYVIPQYSDAIILEKKK